MSEIAEEKQVTVERELREWFADLSRTLFIRCHGINPVLLLTRDLATEIVLAHRDYALAVEEGWKIQTNWGELTIRLLSEGKHG